MAVSSLELTNTMRALKNTYTYRESPFFSAISPKSYSPQQQQAVYQFIDSFSYLKEYICSEVSAAMTATQVRSDNKAIDLAIILFYSFCGTLEGSAIGAAVERLSNRLRSLEDLVSRSRVVDGSSMYVVSKAFAYEHNLKQFEYTSLQDLVSSVEHAVYGYIGSIVGRTFSSLSECYNYFSPNQPTNHIVPCDTIVDYTRQATLDLLLDHHKAERATFALQELCTLRRELEFVRTQQQYGREFITSLIDTAAATFAASERAAVATLQEKLRASTDELEALRQEVRCANELVSVLYTYLEAANAYKCMFYQHATELKNTTQQSYNEYVDMLEQQISSLHEIGAQYKRQFYRTIKMQQSKARCYKQSCDCYSNIVRAQESRMKATVPRDGDDYIATSLKDCTELYRKLQATVSEINEDLRVNDL